ncbi:hypothetical protein ACLB2K_001377 [Fragaria x ananassa]
MKTKKIVSQRCLNGSGNRSKTGGDARRNRNNFLSSSQCQICREKDTAVRCSYRNIALPDQSSNSVLICQICDMKGHAALECNHLGTHIGVSPVVVDGGEQTVVIDEREHNMINDDGSDNFGRAVVTDEREHNMINDDGSDNFGRAVVTDEREHNMINGDGSDKSGRENIGGVFIDGSDHSGRAVVTDEREHNMINGDGSDKSGRENIGGVFVAEDISSTGSDENDSSGRENIGGVFVAEDISSTGSDESDRSGRENIGGVCSVAEDCSSTGSSIGIRYVDQVSVDQVPPDIASFEAVIRNSVCSVVGGLKRNSTKALHSLESCLLCATGSEAMHTDTFVCLVLSSLMWGYLGHTAYLMENPSGADQHLFPSISSGIYANNLVDIAPMGVSSSCAAL